MFKALTESWTQTLLPAELLERVQAAVGPLNSAGYDPWGLEPQALSRVVALTRWLYTHYFRVETVGLEDLPAGRVLIVANHSGQLPFDALMAFLSLILAAEPPRIARGMVDYWVPSLPFVSALMNRGGSVVGSPRNCLDLLEAEQCVLVFPEGTRGLGKPFAKRYQLQTFGTGFLRLALETRTPIVPLAVVGAEEIYPGIGSVEPLAKMLGFPYVPITPFFPWLGPLGALPLPCKITLRYGAPLTFAGDPDMSEEELAPLVEQVRGAIRLELKKGLKARGANLFTASAAGSRPRRRKGAQP